MNDKTIIRAEHNKQYPYTCISNETLQMRRLSYEARGMLGELLSRPDNWEIRPGQLIMDGKEDGPKCGRDKVRRILRELINAGYIKRTSKFNTEKGYSDVSYKLTGLAKAQLEDLSIEQLRALPYPVYLTTKHWQAFRKEALQAHGAYCHQCYSVEQLDAHHLTYKRIGQERIEDVQILCRECHSCLHGQEM